MSGGMIFILVVFVVLRIIIMQKQEKKKKEEQQRRAPQAETPQPVPAQASQIRPQPARPADDRFPDVAPRPAPRPVRPARPRPADDRFPDLTPRDTGSMPYTSLEGGGRGVSMAYESTEGTGGVGSIAYTSAEGPGGESGRLSHMDVTLRQTPEHVVQALTESDHTHMESSMTGAAPCPPDSAPSVAQHDAAYAIRDTASPAAAFVFDRPSAIRGVLYAEILGKPRAKKRRA